MELIYVRKGQYQGYYMRHNVLDWDEIVEVPAGKYFRNGEQLIVALQIRDDKYSLSSKHGYMITKPDNNLTDKEIRKQIKEMVEKARLVIKLLENNSQVKNYHG